METENNALSKKVDLASTIRIKNLTVTPIKEYSADKVTTKSRIKDKINICFTAEANEVVASAEEVFHILIIDPTGIALEQPSSLPTEKLQDTISADSNGKPKVRYTTTATCHYENEEINVCASWQLVERLAKGLYTVEISNKGYLVGKTTFNL